MKLCSSLPQICGHRRAAPCRAARTGSALRRYIRPTRTLRDRRSRDDLTVRDYHPTRRCSPNTAKIAAADEYSAHRITDSQSLVGGGRGGRDCCFFAHSLVRSLELVENFKILDLTATASCQLTTLGHSDEQTFLQPTTFTGCSVLLIDDALAVVFTLS